MQKAKTVKIKLAHKSVLLAVAVLTVFTASILVIRTSGCDEKYRLDTTIRSSESALFAEIVNSPRDMQKGLSGRSCIGKEQAMLFKFDRTDLHGIWMKDMNFTIDIIWLNSEKKVVHIENEVAPSTYPDVFYPKEPALYVIETHSGFALQSAIKVGTGFNW